MKTLKNAQEEGVLENNIYNADCLDIMRLMKDKSIDLVVTDPPYGLNFRSHRPMATKKKDFIENDKPEDLIPLVWDKEFVGLGWDWRFQYETIFQLVKGKGIHNIDTGASNVIRAKKIIPQEGEHPTPKSVDIIAEILKRKPSEFVFDPFAGGGSTLEAAKFFNRKYIGIEIIEKYCKIAEDRLRQGMLF